MKKLLFVSLLIFDIYSMEKHIELLNSHEKEQTLLEAVSSYNAPLAVTMLQQGTNPNTKSSRGIPLVIIALMNCAPIKLEIASMQLDKSIDELLELAHKCINMLLTHPNINVAVSDLHGTQPLSYAISYELLEVADRIKSKLNAQMSVIVQKV